MVYNRNTDLILILKYDHNIDTRLLYQMIIIQILKYNDENHVENSSYVIKRGSKSYKATVIP